MVGLECYKDDKLLMNFLERCVPVWMKSGEAARSYAAGWRRIEKS